MTANGAYISQVPPFSPCQIPGLGLSKSNRANLAIKTISTFEFWLWSCGFGLSLREAQWVDALLLDEVMLGPPLWPDLTSCLDPVSISIYSGVRESLDAAIRHLRVETHMCRRSLGVLTVVLLWPQYRGQQGPDRGPQQFQCCHCKVRGKPNLISALKSVKCFCCPLSYPSSRKISVLLVPGSHRSQPNFRQPQNQREQNTPGFPPLLTSKGH